MSYGEVAVYLYATVIKHGDTYMPASALPSPAAVALPGGVKTPICLFMSHEPATHWNLGKYDE